MDKLTRQMEQMRQQNAEITAAREAAERAADHNARLQAVTAALSEPLAPAQVAEVIVGHALDALGAHICIVTLLTNQNTEFEVIGAAGYCQEVLDAWRRFAVDAPVPIADAVRTGEPVWLASREECVARYPHLADIQAVPGSGALVAVPLSVDGRAVGGLGLSFPATRDFGEEDRPFLLTLARQCAQAIARAQAQEASRASGERLRAVVHSAPVVLWAVDQGGVFTFSDGKPLTALGLRPGEVVGRSVFDVYRDVPQVLEDVRRALAGEEFTSIVEVAGLVFESRYSPLRDQSGNLAGVTGVATDITERKRAETLAAGQARVLEMLATGAPLEHVLAALARMIEAQSPEILCSLLLLDEEGKHLRCGAAPSFPEDYNAAIDGMAIGPDAGTCGTAAHSGKRTIATDIASDPGWSAFRDLALSHRLRSCWSDPIRSRNGNVLGTFAIYGRDPGGPGPNHLRLLETASHLAAIAIERKREEEALRRAHDELEMRVQERTAELGRANARLRAQIIERRRAEHVSRGQTTALTHMLNALTAQPELDTFLEQVVTAIAEQLGSQHTSLWFYNPEQSSLFLHMTYDGGHILSYERAGHPAASAPFLSCRTPLWQEMVRTRQPLVLDDIAHDGRLWNREWLPPQGVETLLLVPLVLGDAVIGWLSVCSADARRYRPEEIELAQALAQQATLAVQMTRLAEQGQQTAILQERNRIARDIHDTLAQGFTGIVVQLEAAEDALTKAPAQAPLYIVRARDLARQSLSEARRSVWALRPQALEEGRLPGALEDLARQMTFGTSIHAEFYVHGKPQALAAEVESNLLRIGQEALTNILKHARASAARVELSFERRQVRLSVQDNGQGFDPGLPAVADGFGLTGMRERAKGLGGQLTLSSRPGHGTEVVVVAPTTGRP